MPDLGAAPGMAGRAFIDEPPAGRWTASRWHSRLGRLALHDRLARPSPRALIEPRLTTSAPDAGEVSRGEFPAPVGRATHPSRRGCSTIARFSGRCNLPPTRSLAGPGSLPGGAPLALRRRTRTSCAGDARRSATPKAAAAALTHRGAQPGRAGRGRCPPRRPPSCPRARIGGRTNACVPKHQPDGPLRHPEIGWPKPPFRSTRRQALRGPITRRSSHLELHWAARRVLRPPRTQRSGQKVDDHATP